MENRSATVLGRLAEIVGHEHVLTAQRDVEPYLVDWRGRYRGNALAVVRPADTPQVAAVVAACAEARIAIVPQGGNTGMCGGATPDASGSEVLVSLGRMRAIRTLDRGNATMTVEAGVTLAAAQQAASDAGAGTWQMSAGHRLNVWDPSRTTRIA